MKKKNINAKKKCILYGQVCDFLSIIPKYECAQRKKCRNGLMNIFTLQS